MGEDKGGLAARALVPAEGGEWRGLLFDNPVIGVEPALTWTFEVPCEQVDGDPVALSVDWLPVEAPGWQQMAGRSASSPEFAEPAEVSVHFAGRHHRFDRVELRVAEQQGGRIRVVATVGGDLDGLGPDEFTVEAWLGFGGILVQLNGVASAEEALRRLGGFTDTAGLAELPDPRGIAYRFG